MSSPIEGIPAELVSADVEQRSVTFHANATVYPLEALYASAYVFIDRCYVFVDKPDAGSYRITLSPKKGEADEATLRTWIGEFANELLSCAWRAQIAQENRLLIETVTTQALSGSMGPPTLDDLEKFDFAEDSFDDPLGIAMSWEEKYKKKDKVADAAPGVTEAAPNAAAASSGKQGGA